ncbi:cytidylyltransferase domain-containing protein [Poriferisphaera sp. WC338]|uniref:acylneuraminate cytidylyltransferase family protein n=1 Tax=Poriferisphaera sp. WC338 TaxID=3425129 RepID=UPI003D8159BE
MAKVLGIILARAGSVGLPQKNELDLCGKPMLRWTIDHALGAGCLDEVVLSTDGERLAAIGEDAGVKVMMRPSELATGTATVDAAARDVVEKMEADGERFDAVVILYGNVPVRPVDLTDRAVKKLWESGGDSVQSVSPVEKMHPYWMKTVGDEDELLMYEDNHVYRRQDLPPVYILDGGMIAVTRASLFDVVEGEPHAFLGKDRRAVVTGVGEVVDVDSMIDMKVAEAVLAAHGNGG